MIHANQLAALAAAIRHVAPLAGPADALLSAFFRAHPALGARDRAFVAEGVFAWLRRRRSLEALSSPSLHPGLRRDDAARRLALAVVAREGLASVRDLAPIVSGEEAQWLAAFKARLREPLPPAVAADVPDWLWERLGAAYDEPTRAALTRAWQQPAPFDLRVNAMKARREDALAALVADGFDATATPHAPLGIRVRGRPHLAGHPWLADGRVEVQDEGSQLVAQLVAPRRSDMVVDFCAGAGGKTLALGALMRSQGRLYAFDVNDKRLAKLGPRLARSGLSNVHAQRIDSERDAKVRRLAGKIDRVLVDAPCTGFGTLRRNPDLKWRQTAADVAELTARQASILAAASTLVKPGGRLVYATCSVLPEENDAIVDAFLAAHPAFGAVDAAAELARLPIPLDTGSRLRLFPHVHGCDGFFAAVLGRIG